MAAIFLRSGGSDANGGTDKGSPKATLASALTAAGAGGVVYMSDAHAETQSGSMALASPGTAASRTRVVCVPDWGAATGITAPTGLSTGGSVSVTGSGSQITWSGSAYYYGITFAGANAGNADLLILTTASSVVEFDSCRLHLLTTVARTIRMGNTLSDTRVICRSCVFKFGGTGNTINLLAPVSMMGCSIDGSGTIPTAGLFKTPAGTVGNLICVACDWSALGSNAIVLASQGTDVKLVDCKIGASAALTTGTSSAGAWIEAINVDSGNTTYRYYRTIYEGTEQHETTIVRSGGASIGTTVISRKIVTSANTSGAANVYYRSQPVEFWAASGTVSVSIPVLTDNVTLTDAEAWIEVEGLGTSGYPLGTIVSDRVTDPIFGTPANQTTDSTSTWTTTGLTTPVKQTLDASITTQSAGLVRVYVCVAKASTTVYYDPKALTGSGKQYMSEAGFVNEGAAGSGGVSRARVVNA